MASRAFADSLGVFGTTPHLLLIGILVAGVTAVLVFLIRGWEHFREHIIANIFIAIGGAIASWLLVFVWVLIHLPSKLLAESNANLTNVIKEKRQQSIEINSLNDRVASLEQNAQAQPRIITHTLPALEPEKKCWFSNHVGMPNSIIKGAVTATAAIFRCNYKIEAPWQITLSFDREFIPGALTLPDSGVWFPGGGPGKLGLTYSLQINNPPLLSEQLVIVTVYGNTAQYPRALKASIQARK